LAQDGKAAGDSPLNVRPHAEVSVNENTKVTHRLGWNDVMRPNHECRSWHLVLTASSDTPEQLRLAGVQLETVGRHGLCTVQVMVVQAKVSDFTHSTVN